MSPSSRSGDGREDSSAAVSHGVSPLSGGFSPNSLAPPVSLHSLMKGLDLVLLRLLVEVDESSVSGSGYGESGVSSRGVEGVPPRRGVSSSGGVSEQWKDLLGGGALFHATSEEFGSDWLRAHPEVAATLFARESKFEEALGLYAQLVESAANAVVASTSSGPSDVPVSGGGAVSGAAVGAVSGGAAVGAINPAAARSLNKRLRRLTGEMRDILVRVLAVPVAGNMLLGDGNTQTGFPDGFGAKPRIDVDQGPAQQGFSSELRKVNLVKNYLPVLLRCHPQHGVQVFLASPVENYERSMRPREVLEFLTAASAGSPVGVDGGDVGTQYLEDLIIERQYHDASLATELAARYCDAAACSFLSAAAAAPAARSPEAGRTEDQNQEESALDNSSDRAASHAAYLVARQRFAQFIGSCGVLDVERVLGHMEKAAGKVRDQLGEMHSFFELERCMLYCLRPRLLQNPFLELVSEICCW